MLINFIHVQKLSYLYVSMYNILNTIIGFYYQAIYTRKKYNNCICLQFTTIQTTTQKKKLLYFYIIKLLSLYSLALF
jgi:hypothetical protein